MSPRRASPQAPAHFGFLGLLACIVVALASSAVHAEILRHALVVGVNDGGSALEPLKYAEQDARRMSDLLVELGSFEPEQVTVLYAPDRTTFLAALDVHAQIASATKEDLFVLYYSGHADVRGLRLGDEAVRWDELRQRLRVMPAEVRLGLLDACKSGAIARLKGARVTAPFLQEEEMLATGEAWITAASADESAQESDQLRGSFFTHYLISGLRGAADNGDGMVSIEEAYRYAYQRTVSRTGATEGGTQHPVYDFRLQGEGELVLTDVRKALARVTLPAELGGEISVLRLPDRVPVAEVAKPVGEAVVLALAPGRYLFRLRNDGTIQEVVVGLSEGANPTVARFGPQITPEVAQIKGMGALTLNINEIATQSQARIEAMNLRHSPWVAGMASAIVPGMGQAYNGQWAKGGLCFLGAASLAGGGFLWHGASDGVKTGSLTGPNPLTFVGASIYGYSIADAVWRNQEGKDTRPRTGVVLTTETGWTLDDTGETTETEEMRPTTTGIAADWIIEPGFSLGLDRTGLIFDMEEKSTFQIGSRMTLGVDRGQHLRPGLFVAIGLRAGSVEDRFSFRPVVGGGANLRWYLTPRYLLQAEMREEVDDGVPATVFAAGLGVHLGG